MSNGKKYRRVGMNGEMEDVDFDPFISPDEIRQKSSDEFRKSHDENMQTLTKAIEMHGRTLETHGKILEAIHEHLASPKKIIRDQQGRAVGMESMHNKGTH